MTNALLQPRLVYTCVVSDFNLPELEACTIRRPDEVVLVVSDQYETQAQRLIRALGQLDPTPQVLNLHRRNTHVALGGDDALANQRWVQEVLLPILNDSTRAGAQHWLNLNGGTKVMGVCLMNAYGWHGVDYRAVGDRRIQSVLWDPDERQFLPDRIFELTPDPVSAIQVAQLQADHVSQDSRNPIADPKLAQRIWNAEKDRAPDLCTILDALAKVWEDQTRPSQVAELCWESVLNPTGKHRPNRKDAIDSDSSKQRPQRSGIEAWLNRFNSLLAGQDPGPIHWDETRILIKQGNLPNRQFKHWRAWLKGDWLEQLAASWLLDEGLPESALARNLKSGITEDRSGDKREADLLVHYAGRTSLIEIKAGLPEGAEAKTIEQQLSSLGDRFGRTNKGLLIAPNLRHQLERSGRRWEDFKLRCQAGKVTLLTDRESVVTFIRRPK